MERLKTLLTRPIVLAILMYLVVVALIFPFGEFAVNDDWDFITHVRNFSQGDFVKNSLMDSSFILQGLIGVVWTSVFGLSFTALKILTILLTIVLLYGAEKILRFLNVRPSIRLIALLTLVFNPFVLSSSLTFMTEIYFLNAVVWSVFFTLLYYKDQKTKYVFAAVVFACASVLVRQIGLIFLPVVLGILFYKDFYLNRSKLSVHHLFIVGISLVSIVAALYWPQYNADNEKPVQLLTLALSSIHELTRMAHDMFFGIPYFGLSLLPFGLLCFATLSKKIMAVVTIASFILLSIFIDVDVFKIGNVLYPEGLLIKSNYVQHITLVDNLPFKLVLGFLVLLAALSSLIFFIKAVKTKRDANFWILVIFCGALSLPILMYEGFYDRYLVNGLVLCVLLFAYIIPQQLSKLQKIAATLGVVFVIFYSTLITQEFFTVTRTQWKMAEDIESSRELQYRIFLSGTYTRYKHVFFKKNSAEIKSPMPRGITYECYVQKDVEENRGNPLNLLLYRISYSQLINKFVLNPIPFDRTYQPGYREPSRDRDKIIDRREIYPLTELLVGNKTFIVSYCQK